MMKTNSNATHKNPNPAAGVAKAAEAAKTTNEAGGADDDAYDLKIPGGVKKPGTP